MIVQHVKDIATSDRIAPQHLAAVQEDGNRSDEICVAIDLI
jgi:hypothetical protein